MSYPVSYHCPHCGAVVEVEREGYLADKAVTPYPLEGWSYVAPDESFGAADGVRFVCGRDAGPVDWKPAVWSDAAGPGRSAGSDGPVEPEERAADGAPEATGCGEPFYLSFVRTEDGEEVDPRSPSEFVEIDVSPGPTGPSGPDL